jgi:hypothetical protein
LLPDSLRLLRRLRRLCFGCCLGCCRVDHLCMWWWGIGTQSRGVRILTEVNMK